MSELECISMDNASVVWSAVEKQLDAFCQAWDGAAEPPEIADFVGDYEPAVRRLILLELIKVDLEYRWNQPKQVQEMESYIESWPELRVGGVPAELLYEDIFQRRQHGEQVDINDYSERFPDSAAALKRLLGMESADISTCMNQGRISHQQFQVGDTIDDFELRAELGRGAFGVVFLAIQRSMQRMVALKISANRGTEAQVLAQLEHAHIVRVYDRRVIEEKDLQLFYMQYVRGGTLHGALRYVHGHDPTEWSGKLLMEAIDRTLDSVGEVIPAPTPARIAMSQSDWRKATCDMGIQLASALDYAHQKNTLHRDVKPANILLTVDGVAKLADFNISCSSKIDGASPAAYFGGSLAYMSPEQLEAYNPDHSRLPDSLDGRSDVYSTAVVVWEMLTGSRPFGDETLCETWEQTLETMTRRRTEGLTSDEWSKLPRDCPSALRQFFVKSLDPLPENRFSAAADAIRLLRIAGSASPEQSSSWQQWLLQFARKHPFFVSFLVAVVPNALAAVFVAKYNAKWIQQSDNTAFALATTVINGLFFPLGVLVVVRFTWPLAKALKARREGNPVSTDVQITARNRSLNLGRLVLVLGMVLWTIAGPIYWAFLQKGAADFIVSHVLGGLIAGSFPFFIFTFIGIVAWYPPFLETAVDDDGTELKLLQSTSRTLSLVELLAAALPMFATILLVFFPGSKDTLAEHQRLLSILSVVSLLTFGISFWLSRTIQKRIEKLKSVLLPGELTQQQT